MCNKFVVATETKDPEVVERKVSLVRSDNGVSVRVDGIDVCLLADGGDQGSDLHIWELSKATARSIGFKHDSTRFGGIAVR